MRSVIMVRGNVGAAPDYFAAHNRPDGSMAQSKWSMCVYEQRRRLTAQGTYVPDPKGALKVTVQVFGAKADLLHRLDIRQGDPIVAWGSIADPAAYMTRSGVPGARLVLTAEYVGFDTLRLQARADREQAQQSSGAAKPTAGDAAATTASNTDGDLYAADMFDAADWQE